ncbi:MAG: hypothetical protein AB7P33_13530, partial [Dehalococcoidia bacterium]
MSTGIEIPVLIIWAGCEAAVSAAAKPVVFCRLLRSAPSDYAAFITMADLDRVLSWFDAGTLLRPDPLRPSTYSLSYALAAAGGAKVDLDESASRIADVIGEPDHVILVLADG